MEKGEVVQITNEEHKWYPCLIIVQEVKSFGIQGYIILPTNDKEQNGAAYIRLNKDDYESLGVKVIIDVK